MEEMWSVYDSMVRKSGYKYDCLKFKEVLKESKEYLLKLNTEKRLEIIRELLKNPNFDGTDVYYLTMIEIQQDTSCKPPLVVPQKHRSCKIRFVMSGRRPTEPIREEEKAPRRSDKTGRKRSRGSSSDCEFDEGDEKVRANKKKKKKKKKKKVNNLVITENIPDLPSYLKERIRNLGGTEASLVIQKELYATDVSSGHGRLSLPWMQMKDKEFLSEKEKEFLDGRIDEFPEIEARLIGENGKEHETGIRVWNSIPNLGKRLRSSSDCEFDEEEEKDRAMKTKKKKKKKVNDFVLGGLPEKRPDLPTEFKERIQKLGGTKASLVIQKKLFPTDVSTYHKRLSIPWLQIEDKEFLSGEERAFLAKIRTENGAAAEIEARVIGENGKEYEIGMRQWNTRSTVYNFVKGWNGVVSDHRLCEDMIVQLWSFRVEGKLGFALVKLGISEKAKEKLGIS